MKPTPPPSTDPRLLLLAPGDNVLTALAALDAGGRVRVRGRWCTLATRIPFGHKVAAAAIPQGGQVIKYGVPIGSATRPIAPGEHVHTHNLRSDYLPTYLRHEQNRFFARHP